jgi:AMP deaminase
MDFFNIKKVDNHIHHTAAMSASHLRKFIKKKYNSEA